MRYIGGWYVMELVIISYSCHLIRRDLYLRLHRIVHNDLTLVVLGRRSAATITAILMMRLLLLLRLMELLRRTSHLPQRIVRQCILHMRRQLLLGTWTTHLRTTTMRTHIGEFFAAGGRHAATVATVTVSVVTVVGHTAVVVIVSRLHRIVAVSPSIVHVLVIMRSSTVEVGIWFTWPAPFSCLIRSSGAVQVLRKRRLNGRNLRRRRLTGLWSLWSGLLLLLWLWRRWCCCWRNRRKRLNSGHHHHAGSIWRLL